MTAALSSMGALTALPPLPTITNKPPPVPAQPNMAALEEAKKKVAKQANSISIKEFTDVRQQSSGIVYFKLPPICHMAIGTGVALNFDE